ncbi:MAG: MBOAT family protein [Lachnospiraceae bacterium]|nr:MBOAT family protein [Lachnospiraceae bacterium]
MTFTSTVFLIGIFPWFIIIFYLSRKNYESRKTLLFFINILFYIWSGIGAFIITSIICLITYFFCKINLNYKSKVLFIFEVIVVLLPLLTIKYTYFIVDNINKITGFDFETPAFIVPVGISFFTFQAISLISDVYSDKISIIYLYDVYLYLTFFATITSGPIIRFDCFEKGLKNNISLESYNYGIQRVSYGLCKKVLIADKLGGLVDYYFDGVSGGISYSTLGLWLGSFAYTLQLYYDFSGYSDMAIGIGRLLGFDLPENFNAPYIAGSISEFWRRWHISLSRWFRDYVYIPLGGNRVSTAKHIRNLLIVWIMTGVWHGSNWTFVIWGLGYFVILLLEKYCPILKNIDSHWYGHIYALFFINILWVLFRSSNMKTAIIYIKGMFGFNIGIEKKALNYIPYLVISILLCLPWSRILIKYKEKTVLKIIKNIIWFIIVVLAICAVINASYAPYIYGGF